MSISSSCHATRIRKALALILISFTAVGTTGCALYERITDELIESSSGENAAPDIYFDAGVHINNWIQPEETAEGTAQSLQQSAPGAEVTSEADDSAGGFGLRFGASLNVIPSETPDDTGLDIDGWIEGAQSGDFESRVTVSAGDKSVRTISEFDPDPEIGFGIAPMLQWGQWEAGPTVSVVRHDIGVTIRDQFLETRNGQQEVANETVDRKVVKEWNVCIGGQLARFVSKQFSAGLLYRRCDVNDNDYESVAGFVRWHLGSPAAMQGP